MSNDVSPPSAESSGSLATGSMTGTITYLHDSQVVEFSAHQVIRSVVGGYTQVFAQMSVPGPDNAYRIYLRFPGNEPTSGTYAIGSADIAVFVDIANDGGHHAANSGHVLLQNHIPTRTLIGSADFKTIPRGNIEYEIQVVFEISDTLKGV
ncbi:hypothetical protein [Pseudomonas sp. LB3P31]